MFQHVLAVSQNLVRMRVHKEKTIITIIISYNKLICIQQIQGPVDWYKQRSGIYVATTWKFKPSAAVLNCIYALLDFFFVFLPYVGLNLFGIARSNSQQTKNCMCGVAEYENTCVRMINILQLKFITTILWQSCVHYCLSLSVCETLWNNFCQCKTVKLLHTRTKYCTIILLYSRRDAARYTKNHVVHRINAKVGTFSIIYSSFSDRWHLSKEMTHWTYTTIANFDETCWKNVLKNQQIGNYAAVNLQPNGLRWCMMPACVSATQKEIYSL